MSLGNLSPDSTWSAERTEEFLRSYRAPMRIAAQAEGGFPMLCSLWFRYDAGAILCATKRDARITRRLAADPRCAFELAPNEPPYFGVRGRGLASISREGSVELLAELIDLYLGDRESELARWLLANTEKEVTLSIAIEWITSWDYSSRMAR